VLSTEFGTILVPPRPEEDRLKSGGRQEPFIRRRGPDRKEKKKTSTLSGGRTACRRRGLVGSASTFRWGRPLKTTFVTKLLLFDDEGGDGKRRKPGLKNWKTGGNWHGRGGGANESSLLRRSGY